MTIEDELHVLECPRYAAERATLGQMPHTWTDSSIKGFFNKTEGAEWQKLAHFLVFCRRTKMDILGDGVDQ